MKCRGINDYYPMNTEIYPYCAGRNKNRIKCYLLFHCSEITFINTIDFELRCLPMKLTSNYLGGVFKA